MKKISKDKIQCLLINHLLQEGSIELLLPDGLVIEVGLTQENKHGDLEITPDYCWVIASQHGRAVAIDSYNLGLRFISEDDKMLFEHNTTSNEGCSMKILDVV